VGGRRPNTRKTTATIKPTTNKIQAMLAAVPANPVNPNSAAISAITKKVTAQPNIAITPLKERSRNAEPVEFASYRSASSSRHNSAPRSVRHRPFKKEGPMYLALAKVVPACTQP
jgi:hypothetical protein